MVSSSYHHGDLPRALIDAVGELIDRDGLGAVSLRAVARHVGVSHAAPAHHFDDKAGLLAAFAAEGFEQLAGALRSARERAATADPLDRLEACGNAYVDFAVSHRAHFEVMFRPELHSDDDRHHETVAEPGDDAFAVLLATVAECIGGDADPERVRGLALASWAGVHGLATLWLDGPLPGMLECDPDSRRDLEAVAAPVLAAMRRAVAAG